MNGQMVDPGTAVPADHLINGGTCYECGYSLGEIVRANPAGWLLMLALITTLVLVAYGNLPRVLRWLDGA